MSGLARDILQIADDIRPLFEKISGVRPDFSNADLTTTTAAISVLVERGIDIPEAIHAYLRERGCQHGLPTIRFLLDAYAGADRRQCFWFRTAAGRYKPLG